MDVRLPQLAEGADSGAVVSVFVSEGQEIQKDQTILELENQKAVAPIPAPAAGKVTKVHVKPGDEISVGHVLISLEPAGSGAEKPSGAGAADTVRGEPVGPRTSAASFGQAQDGLRQAQGERDFLYTSPSGAPPPAGPAVRKVAQELGIDLRRVRGSERGGRITTADLRAYVAALERRAQAGGPGKPAAPAKPIDFSRWGPVTRKPMSGLRKAISRAMTDSWTTIPHVTQFDQADPSRLLQWIEKHGPSYEKKGARLTLTGFLIKAVVSALKKYPAFNTSLDEAAEEIVFKEYIHIGIAVDTEQGLIVPVLRDADKKNLLQISKELADLADRTRKRKLSAEELQGATFTISNQGGIGGGHFTPIIHKPEVAVLGVGRGAKGTLPLSLSYDHRVVDGADAARFITELARIIEQFTDSEVTL
ncbi:MAG: 2-oxo acid dehydrogenase subunit E2 [Candidatus Omnitrophica bacterium]|nr:2-oxo acid dehydrogenase subunit E2 [Candidatus Omnitrophota bacterium]